MALASPVAKAAATPEAVAEAVAALRAAFGDRVSTLGGARDEHGRGFSHYPSFPPDAVVFARSRDDVRQTVEICARHRVPLIPYGAGTSNHGQIAALRGGISLDVQGMDRIVAVHQEDMDVVVEPGVHRIQLNQYLRDTGLFFPVDPGADATIGGMTSTRASGTNAVRYGTMKDNVLALEAVTPDGRVVRIGNRAKKSAMGYDLTRLFVGSEGTLGVLTEITLRLHPIPEAINAGVCAFATLRGAVETAIQAIQMGIPIARVELLDEWSIRASNMHSNLTLKELPSLFLEFHGTTAGVAEQVALFDAIARDNGCEDIAWAERPEDRDRLWKARHEAAFATTTYWAGKEKVTTDVCVPLSALVDAVLATRADIDASTIEGKIIGHVGDGQFHTSYVVRPDSEADFAEAGRLYQRMVERALAAGGTASGEHGVGFSMLSYMEKEHGEALGLMRAIKTAIDPLGIMNPGKLVALP